MKKLILIGLISSQLNAADLIFKHGFETALLTGTASGLVSTGLVLKLSSNATTSTLAITGNGEFFFDQNVDVGADWSVTIVSLPNSPQPQSCTLNNQTGTMPADGVNTLQVNCTNTAWNWNEMNWDTGGWN